MANDKVYKERRGEDWINTESIILHNKIWLMHASNLHKPQIPKCFMDERTQNSSSYHVQNDHGSSMFTINDYYSKENNSSFASDTQGSTAHAKQNIMFPREVPVNVLNEIIQLIKSYPEGLLLEKLNHNYWRMYGKHLLPEDYGFDDMVDLMQSLIEVVLLEENSHGQMILKIKMADGMDNAEESASNIPFQIKETFKIILKYNQGFCLLDNLLPEFEMRTGQRLDLLKLGFKSVFDLVSCLKEIFHLRRLSNGQFVLHDPTIPLADASNVLEDTLSDSVNQHHLKRSFNSETVSRLRRLVEVEYPRGLTIDEVIGAYRGLFGSTLIDLDHDAYGYRSLEGLLRAHPEVVTIQNWGGAVRVVQDQSLLSAEEKKNWNEENSLLPERAVNLGSSYKCPDTTILMPPGGFVEVVIGEVYSPHKFWMIHRGVHTSQALDALMDRMFEFYGSPIGERYIVPKDEMTMGCPVVALYANDLNYYRAIVTGLEDLATVKLFFVDFGTICRCDYSALRLLHKSFFELPAQAIKASLSNVIPLNGRRLWPRSASQRFLEMIQDKAFVAQIVSSEKSTSVCLWDTNGQHDINIGSTLIAEGFALPHITNAVEGAVGTGSCKKESQSDISFCSHISQEREEHLYGREKEGSISHISPSSEGAKMQGNIECHKDICSNENLDLKHTREISNANIGNNTSPGSLEGNTFIEGSPNDIDSGLPSNCISNFNDVIHDLLHKISELQNENNKLKVLTMFNSQLGIGQTNGSVVSHSALMESFQFNSSLGSMPSTSDSTISKNPSRRETASISTEGHKLYDIRTTDDEAPVNASLKKNVADGPPPGFSPLPIHQFYKESDSGPTTKAIFETAASPLKATEDIFYSDESDGIPEYTPSKTEQILDCLSTQIEQIPYCPSAKTEQIPDLPSANTEQIPDLLSANTEQIPDISSANTKQIPDLPSANTQQIPDLPSANTQQIPDLPSANTQQIPGLPSVSTEPIPDLPSANTEQIPGLPSVSTEPIPDLPSANTEQIPGLPSVNTEQIPDLPSANTEQIPDSPLSNIEQIPDSPLTNREKIPHSPLTNRDQIPDCPLANREQIPDSPLAKREQIPDSPLANREQIPDSPLANREQIPDSPLANREHISHLPSANTEEIPDYSSVNSEQIPDFPSANTEQIPDYPSVNTEQIPDYPSDNTEQIPECSLANTEQIPDFPSANTEQISDFPSANMEQISDCPSAKTKQIPECPSTNTKQLPPLPLANAVQIPDCPSANAEEIPECPLANVECIPEYPSVNTEQIPQCPLANGELSPQCPSANSEQIPDCPSANTEQIPEWPSAKRVQISDCPSDTCVSLANFENKYVFHLLIVKEEPYILREELLYVLLWKTETLEGVLEHSGIQLSSVTLTVKSHPDIYLQLIEAEADAVYDDNTGKLKPIMIAYHLKTLHLIFKNCKHIDKDLILWIESMCDTYETSNTKMGGKLVLDPCVTDDQLLVDERMKSEGEEASAETSNTKMEEKLVLDAYVTDDQLLVDEMIRSEGEEASAEISISSVHRKVEQTFSEAISNMINTKDEEILKESEINDCIKKLHELSKSDERFKTVINTIDLLKSYLSSKPEVKTDILLLIDFTNEIWSKKSSDQIILNSSEDTLISMDVLQTLREGTKLTEKRFEVQNYGSTQKTSFEHKDQVHHINAEYKDLSKDAEIDMTYDKQSVFLTQDEISLTLNEKITSQRNFCFDEDISLRVQPEYLLYKQASFQMHEMNSIPGATEEPYEGSSLPLSLHGNMVEIQNKILNFDVNNFALQETLQETALPRTFNENAQREPFRSHIQDNLLSYDVNNLKEKEVLQERVWVSDEEVSSPTTLQKNLQHIQEEISHHGRINISETEINKEEMQKNALPKQLNEDVQNKEYSFHIIDEKINCTSKSDMYETQALESSEWLDDETISFPKPLPESMPSDVCRAVNPEKSPAAKKIPPKFTLRSLKCQRETPNKLNSLASPLPENGFRRPSISKKGSPSTSFSNSPRLPGGKSSSFNPITPGLMQYDFRHTSHVYDMLPNIFNLQGSNNARPANPVQSGFYVQRSICSAPVVVPVIPVIMPISVFQNSIIFWEDFSY